MMGTDQVFSVRMALTIYNAIRQEETEVADLSRKQLLTRGEI